MFPWLPKYCSCSRVFFYCMCFINEMLTCTCICVWFKFLTKEYLSSIQYIEKQRQNVHMIITISLTYFYVFKINNFSIHSDSVDLKLMFPTLNTWIFCVLVKKVNFFLLSFTRICFSVFLWALQCHNTLRLQPLCGMKSSPDMLQPMSHRSHYSSLDKASSLYFCLSLTAWRGENTLQKQEV